MRLTSGTRLGSYEILAPLGAGGMGEVYKARDTRLGREVALKVLSDTLAGDSEWLSRFRREAQVLASLNHPNLAAIYGLDDSEATPALVLELVEGPTLAERLTRRVQLGELIGIARQIAAGLEAAHEKGIIHRDLKPANVKIAADGTVKILDFGIAKIIGAAASSAVTATATAPGTTLGTPAYMSPEQLRGDMVDKRTDIWAFGCVVYEMLTGRRAFGGATVPDTIAAIVEKQPDWDALPAAVPDSMRTLLRRCLAKNPTDRLRDIADAGLELNDALASDDAARSRASGLRTRERLLWLGAFGITVTVAALISINLRQATSSSKAIEFGLRFPPGHYIGGGLAVSPDGRFIVTRLASTTSGLWLTALDSSESHPLAGGEEGSSPFWSPDGSQVAFFRRGKLSRMTLSGGPVVDICEATPLFTSGTWNADGVILFAAGRHMMRVAASGGTPEPLTLDIGADALSVASPQFLPDGRHFLFQTIFGSNSTWRIGSLDSDRVVDVLQVPGPTQFVKPNHILFVRGSALVTQALDLATFHLTGSEQTLVRNVMPGARSMSPVFAASEGILVAMTPMSGERGELVWFDQNGARLASIPSPSEGEYLNPSISPDGTEVAVNASEPQTGNWDVWIWSQERAFARRLTNDPAIDGDPLWSADGKHIVFMSNRGGRLAFYRRPADGSGGDEMIASLDVPASAVNDVLLGDWSRDGQYLAYAFRYTVWVLPLSGQRAPLRLTDERFVSFNPRFSPDGRWIAFNDNSTGKLEVHVRPFMREGAPTQISHGGAVHPRWIANGRGLAFTKIGGGVSTVDFDFTRAGMRVGPERTMVPVPVLAVGDSRAHYDVARDGRRVLARQPAGVPGAPMTVVVNWTTRLQ